MEFTVPQFIEKEAKIVGPLTFKQFLFIGTAGAICIILFFAVPLYLFVIFTIILVGGAAFLALYRKEGIPFYAIVFKSFMYLFKPKVFLWKKKIAPIRIARSDVLKRKMEEQKLEEEEHKGPRLKVSRSSKLNDLYTHIETK